MIQTNGTDKIETNSPEAQGKDKVEEKPKGKVKGFLTFYNYDDKTKNINEVSNKLLASYKEKASKSADDLASQGKYKQSTNRRLNVMKATGKQIEKTTYNIGQSLKYGSAAKLKEELQLFETALNPADPHEDYKAKRKALQDIQMDHHTGKDPELTAELARRKADLEKEYDKYRVHEETKEEQNDRKKQLKRFRK